MLSISKFIANHAVWQIVLVQVSPKSAQRVAPRKDVRSFTNSNKSLGVKIFAISDSLMVILYFSSTDAMRFATSADSAAKSSRKRSASRTFRAPNCNPTNLWISSNVTSLIMQHLCDFGDKKTRIILSLFNWLGGDSDGTSRNVIPQTHPDRHPLDRWQDR